MNSKSSSRQEPLLRPMRRRDWQIRPCISSSGGSVGRPRVGGLCRAALNDRKARPNASSTSGRGHRAKTMALADQHSRGEAVVGFDRDGLPHERVAAWLDTDERLTGDFRRDCETFSRRWAMGADLLEQLPAKPARSDAQAAAAVAIMERDRAARAKFLDVHVETLYRRLTADFASFKRIDDLVSDASGAVPGLVPD